MTSYRIVLKESVLREIRRFPRFVLDAIRERIAALAHDPFPSGVEKIQGYDHHYRIRVRNYRIVYEVASHIRIITIIRIGHRKDVYRGL
ncbi:type II toxin-antitoxin system RelE/ParE family toxin [Candidatus Peregrinibacteria bacterium]|nr:type II toxin-antitoxin system RelE/ParE family toxin [Candidatus Peregrinibacteria bacterium]